MKQILVFIILIVLISCKNQSPECRIIAPQENAEYTIGEEIQVRIESSDPDGSISEINLFLDNYGIASIRNMPYEYSFNTTDYGIGSHIINATAFDNEGSASSDDVQITILPLFPVVATDTALFVNEYSAFVGGHIIDDGGSAITEKGIYYSTERSPETNGTKIRIGDGPGAFSKTISNLSAVTDYYIKAYAINVAGMSLGDEIRFTTSGFGNFIDIRDGEEYEITKIGEQVWMAENLGYLPEFTRPGGISDSDPQYYVDFHLPPFNIDDVKESDYYLTYGVLYNWTASIDVCPEGWHLPTDDEWEQLAHYIDEQKGPFYHRFDEWRNLGKHLKATSGWNENGNGTDDFGFSALPGGYYDRGSFISIGEMGYWWSMTKDLENSTETGRYLNFVNDDFSKHELRKYIGCSVRCIRN